MRVTARLPAPLQAFAGGRRQGTLDAPAATVAAAPDALAAAGPGGRDRVLTEQGELPATPLRDGAEISILPAVSGGGAVA